LNPIQKSTTSRRDLLAAAGGAALLATVGRESAVAAATPAAAARPQTGELIPAAYRIGPFAIGCQAYTFHRFSVMEAIEKDRAGRRPRDRVLSGPALVAR
jgi:hypothetical protein